MNNCFRQISGWLCVAFLLAGCATPKPAETWVDAEYEGQGFRKYFVVGLSARDLTDQREFENRMVSKLIDAGVLAEPGWQYMPTNRPPDEETIRAAVAKAGADAVLLTRISAFETKTEVITVAPRIGIEPAVYGDPYLDAGVYGGPGMYGGWYDDTIELDYQRATVYTTLFDVGTAKPVWTLSVPEFDPATVKQDIPRYIDTVVDNLLKARLLRP